MDDAVAHAFPLEPSPEDMHRLVDQAMAYITAHIDSLPNQPAANTEGGAELARSLREDLPEQGQPYHKILEFLFQTAIPTSFNCAGPGYLAYVPGGGIFHAAVADLISNAVNRYVGVWAAAPGLAQLEANVVRWFCDIVGYPQSAGGFLTTGGSLANFSAIFTARRERLPDNFLSGTIYTSEQTHHSVQKAALLAGFPPHTIRAVPTDVHYRIRLTALQQQIENDRHSGRKPFLIVGNAGTTNTGAIDDLNALADVAQRESLWLHIDAAYGGFFMLTERGKSRLAGLQRADSITLDPHKGLFLPFGTGSLIVRDQDTLRRAHSGDAAAYLPSMQDDPDFIDFCQISPELSRDFRGLRIWLPFKLHGIEPFRQALEEKLDLAEWATAQLRTMTDIEIIAEPQLSIVAFRLKRPGFDTPALNQLNQRLLNAINSRKRVLLTGTLLGDQTGDVVGDQFVIRICALCFRTHYDRVEMCLEDIRAACREVEAACPRSFPPHA